MNPRIILIIFRKELLDMLRDKRTLIAMLGIPIVLYPALFIFGSQAALMQQDKVAQSSSRVAVAGKGQATIRLWLAGMPKITLRETRNPALDLATGRIQALVEADSDLMQRLGEGRTAAVTIHYDATDAGSQEAVKRIIEGLNEREKGLLETRLKRMGIPADYIDPLDIKRVDEAPRTKATGAVLGMLMPLIMIVMLGVGAFYPAIDLTAGEKERGTFETLLSTPTSSYDILGGKFLAVFVLAMLTGLTNLGSMVVTFAFQLSQLQGTAGVEGFKLPVQSVVVIVLALLPLAFFISAVMMSIAVMARSFRDAQSLLTPFLILLLFPAGLAAIPGVHLTVPMQLVPIANFALLFKDLMTQKVAAQPIAMVLLSTTAYAALALYGAARIFRREDVVLSQDRGLPLTLRRSHFPRRLLPTPGVSLFIFTLCLLLLFYAGTYVQGKYGMWGLVITQWGLFFVPTVFVLWYVRVDLKTALSLRLPSAGVLGAVVVMAVGWAVLSLQLGVWQQKLIPFPPELAKAMEDLTGLGSQPLWVLLLVLGLSPAVCEEVLFRGAVLSGLRRHLPAWALLLCVGTAFGVSHIDVHRMALTGLSGVVLTYVVWRSGTIFPGMLAHFILNATGIVLQTDYVPSAVKPYVEALDKEQGLPWWVIAAAASVSVAGVVLMEKARPRNTASVPFNGHS